MIKAYRPYLTKHAALGMLCFTNKDWKTAAKPFLADNTGFSPFLSGIARVVFIASRFCPATSRIFTQENVLMYDILYKIIFTASFFVFYFKKIYY